MTELLTIVNVIFYYHTGFVNVRMLFLCIIFSSIAIFYIIFVLSSSYINIILVSVVIIIELIIFPIIPIEDICDVEFINKNINKLEYIDCTKELILYDGNILQFSVIKYKNCIKKTIKQKHELF